MRSPNPMTIMQSRLARAEKRISALWGMMMFFLFFILLGVFLGIGAALMGFVR